MVLKNLIAIATAITSPISCQKGYNLDYRKWITQGIVQEVQPLGNYFCDSSKDTPYHKKLEGVANTKIKRHILPLEVVYPPLALMHTGVVELQA